MLLGELIKKHSPPSQIMKLFSKGRLSRELALVLAVKLVLIVTIKLVYFNDANEPDSERVAQALLAAPAHAPERIAQP